MAATTPTGGKLLDDIAIAADALLDFVHRIMTYFEMQYARERETKNCSKCFAQLFTRKL